MRTQEEIVRKINDLLAKCDGKTTLVSAALIWVLDMSKTAQWLDWLDDYYIMYAGHAEFDFRLPIFLEWMGEGKRVLDCGVHTGIMTNEFAKKNDVVGFDLPKVVQKFKYGYDFESLAMSVEEKWLFDDASFDVVVAGEFLHHLRNPGFFVSEAFRVLRCGGLLMLSCPYKQDVITNIHFVHVIDEEFLKSVFQDYFTIKEIRKPEGTGAILVLAVVNKT